MNAAWAWAAGAATLGLALAWRANALPDADGGAAVPPPVQRAVAPTPPSTQHVATGPGMHATLPVTVPVTLPAIAPAPAPAPAPAALPMVSVTLSGPDRLTVGEQAELTVAVGTAAAVGEVALTLRFDPNLLQVRAGAPGAWATGDGRDTRFSAEVNEAADEVQLRAAPGSPPPGAGPGSGSVAQVLIEAVGQGTSAVRMSGVAVMDRSGRALPVLLSMSTLQVTAEAAHPLRAP